jgi:outer membrane biosynthesis protein TonB
MRWLSLYVDLARVSFLLVLCTMTNKTTQINKAITLMMEINTQSEWVTPPKLKQKEERTRQNKKEQQKENKNKNKKRTRRKNKKNKKKEQERRTRKVCQKCQDVSSQKMTLKNTHFEHNTTNTQDKHTRQTHKTNTQDKHTHTSTMLMQLTLSRWSHCPSHFW